MKKFLIKLIRFYKRRVSPGLPPACKYSPACSEYAIDAIQTHGAFFGTGMAIWRVLRCNPFSKGGIDPAPPKQ